MPVLRNVSSHGLVSRRHLLLMSILVVLVRGIATTGVARLVLHRVAVLLIQLLVRAAAEALLGGAQVLVRMCQEIGGKLLDLAQSEMLLLLRAERVRVVVAHGCVIY